MPWSGALASCATVRLWRMAPGGASLELRLGNSWLVVDRTQFFTPDSLPAVDAWLAAGPTTPLPVTLQAGPWQWRHATLEHVPAAGERAGILTARAPWPPAAEREARLPSSPAIAVFDAQMRLLRGSPRWGMMHGLDPESHTGASLYDLFPDLRQSYAATFDRCLAGAHSGLIPTELVLPSGRRIRAQWELWPWLNERGDIGGLILHCAPSGVTPAQQGLSRTQHMLQLAVDTLEQRVFWKDREDRYLGCNQAFARDAGLSSPAEILGRTDREMVWAELAPLYQADDQTVMSSRQPRLNYEERLVTSSGEKWVRTSKVPLLDEQGAVYGCLGLFHDITEEKRRREDLRQARDAAEKANRIKSEFLANISHELRTPMHGILGMAELVMDSPLTAEQVESVEAIHSSAKVLLHIINDILDLSKIEAGKLQLTPAPFELSAFLKTNLRLLESTARNKGLAFTVEVEPGAPLFWRGDQVRLAQILTNLVGNAVKFTHEGGAVTVRVRIGGSDDRRRLLILEVTDTGIGISKTKLSVIFDAFTQADGATTKQLGGTGLGLTITRQLVELMGGRISVESDLGKGSTFTASCRLESLAEAEFLEASANEQPRPRRAAPDVNTSPLQILLVEDNKVNQRIAQRLLEKEGAVVTIANDGWEALETLDREGLHGRFDLVLMDCLMPVMNGWDATRAIRQREEGTPGHLPVMALTASVMESDREMCRNAGMDDVLAKPIDQTHLHQALDEVRRSRALARLSYNLQ